MLVFADWGTSIFNALSNAVNLILTFIPRLIGFLIILAVGLIIATVISKALTFLLRKVGFDRMSERIGLTRFDQRMGVHLDPAGVLGKIVYWFIVLIFLVPAADALGLPAVSNTLNALVAYIPNVFVAILVLFLGTLLATFVADIVRGATASANMGNPRIFAGIARWAIIGFAALVALEQLKITPDLINELFGAMVAAVAIAFGLAFGLGGQDTARRWLSRGESTVTSAASQVAAQQSANQYNTPSQAAAQQSANQYNAPSQIAGQQTANPYSEASQPTVQPGMSQTMDGVQPPTQPMRRSQRPS